MILRLGFRLGAGIVSALAFASFAGAGVAADAAPAYRLTNTIVLGAPDRWDYLYFDAGAKRVYISHGDQVTVVDGKSGAIISTIANLPGSHGIAVSTALKRGVADSAKSQQVTFFDSDTLRPLGTAKAGDDADGIAFDPKTGRAFVANGDAKTVTAVDMATGSFVGTLALGGAPEFLVGDGAGHVFINMESTSEIVDVDAQSLMVTARYTIPDCESPHGIAMDKVTRRLFTSCANEKLVVVDADSGKRVATLPIGKGSDAAAFDPTRKLAFSSNGEGTVTIIAEKSANDFAVVGTLTTTRGARTMTLDPDTGRLYLVSADVDHIDPPKSPGGRPHAVYKPGTVKLYFYDPVP
jgi:DNA-binding beta-propeller fold protein YncE